MTSSTTAMVFEGGESETSPKTVECEFRMEPSFLVGIVKVLSVRLDVVPLDSNFLVHWPMP